MKLRVGLVISHPIQHFCPQYANFAKNDKINFKVFFASTVGLKKYYDPNFKQEISWGSLYLDKFDHVFLNGDIAIPSSANLDATDLEIELMKFKPDVLMVYGYFQKLQRRARRWAIIQKVKLAYISDSENRHKRSYFIRTLIFLWTRIYFSKIDYFLTVGDANEKYYQIHGVKFQQMLRMHFPIDIEHYQRSFETRAVLRSEIRSRYYIGQDEIVLIVVGKLVSWKNQDHIIEAMALLERSEIYVQLFILGSGEMSERLTIQANQLKGSKVHFPGFVEATSLPAFYAASDVYVHPAAMEPHSIAISEAIFMGCPVVVSDRSGSYGPHDDVQVGINGLVYDFGNIIELAERLKSLVEDEHLRKEFSTQSHCIAVEFQNEAHFGIVNKLIDRCLGV